MAKKATKKRRVRDDGESRLVDDREFDDQSVGSDESLPDATSRVRGPRFLADDLDNEDDDGEDLLDKAETDYRKINELDNYDDALLDDASDMDELSVGGRREVDEFLAERDRIISSDINAGKGLSWLQDDLDDLDSLASSDQENSEEEDGFDLNLEQQRQKRRRQRLKAIGERQVALQDFNVPLEEWIQKTHVRREVKRLFADFLKTFSLLSLEDDEDREAPIYTERIIKMCATNGCSLEVDYNHLATAEPILALWLGESAEAMLELFNEATMSVVLETFEGYWKITPDIFVRIRKWPIIEGVREIRAFHIGSMLKAGGVVTKRTAPLVRTKRVTYKCTNGCQLFGPFDFNKRPRPLPFCDLCDEGKTVLYPKKTEYVSHQRLLLQEPPNGVPPGRIPRYKEVWLEGDLIDCCRPGEEIWVTGVLRVKNQKGLQWRENKKFRFPVFPTYLDANCVERVHAGTTDGDLSDKLQELFVKFAKSPVAEEILIQSIAPSVCGMTFAKTALLMALFGGQGKNIRGSHNLRGDIHVLLVGDPGTAKSQCLKYAEKCARRGVYTTGKGASAVGLTAAVHKDPVTREWALEGGALVLADRGVCVIDEFDKMSDQDRTAIHEAMEQQTISVSKAGIVTTLRTRCSIMAAANPIMGRYDMSRSFVDNVMLTDPIIQRFDVLCIVKDIVSKVGDERLAKFVVASHVASHPDDSAISPEEKEKKDGENVEIDENDYDNVNLYHDHLRGQGLLRQADRDSLRKEFGEMLDENGLLTQEMLRKYIEFSKGFRPRFQLADGDRLSRLYVDLRKQSAKHGGIPIAVRHLESIIRLSEAHARMLLKSTVEKEDVDSAIGIMLHSFISAQKASIQGQLRKVFEKYLSNNKVDEQLMLYLLEQMMKQASKKRTVLRDMMEEDNSQQVHVSMNEVEARAAELNIKSSWKFFRSDVFKSKYRLNFAERIITRAI